ncbi:YihY/virulence factor BrkB family protein [Roseicitreum antarcticum]|uniref:YihY/virulence factor BrkB family protein n=1 Tax=Roseicitreum antarcticum TaxID=564137 RepID=UPI001CC20D98|nr:YihY/virulence factor BrkB family protein [Roseicitreum antarcticum]
MQLIQRRHLGLVSAGVAFFAMLAIFPAVAAVIALFGYFTDPQLIQNQLELLSDFIPTDAYTLLRNQVLRLVQTNDSTLGWTSVISIGAALWSARRGVAALIQGLNAIYGTHSRGGLRDMIVAVAMTGAMVLVALVALAALVIVPILLAFFPLGGFYGVLLEVLRWAAALGVLVVGLALFYRYGPNREGVGRGRWASPGLALAVVLWAGASVAFSIFLANFGNYNEVYGSIGAVVALLMWFYISAYSVLLGGVLNSVMEGRHRKEVSPFVDEEPSDTAGGAAASVPSDE